MLEGFHLISFIKDTQLYTVTIIRRLKLMSNGYTILWHAAERRVNFILPIFMDFPQRK